MRISALEDLEAVVEIVVAKRRDVVVERVHRGDDGVDRARLRGDRPGGDVAERRALKTVAIVEQEAVGRLAAGLGDQGRGAREADGIVRAITVIVVRVEVGVQVGDAKQPQAKAGPPRASGGFRSSLRQGLSFVMGNRNGDGGIIAPPRPSGQRGACGCAASAGVWLSELGLAVPSAGRRGDVVRRRIGLDGPEFHQRLDRGGERRRVHLAGDLVALLGGVRVALLSGKREP